MQKSTKLIAVIWLLLAGCQGSPNGENSSRSETQDQAATIVVDASPSDDEKSKLLDAKEALFMQLSGKLMDAMSSNGPASAIEVCQVEAKSIAAEVGKEKNVHIGRTGVRLRNASNQAPGWASNLVADKTETAVFVKLTNGHAAALLPIKLQSQCLMCHGSKDLLAPDVKDKLAKLYPHDQATGFSEGELRGWFWVESLD
jgi:Protein of unknown function (DUF3365)